MIIMTYKKNQGSKINKKKIGIPTMNTKKNNMKDLKKKKIQK